MTYDLDEIMKQQQKLLMIILMKQKQKPMKKARKKKMKIKLAMDCGYIGSDHEEEIEVNDDTTEEELEELATEFFWENFPGSYGYEIIEE